MITARTRVEAKVALRWYDYLIALVTICVLVIDVFATEPASSAVAVCLLGIITLCVLYAAWPHKNVKIARVDIIVEFSARDE